MEKSCQLHVELPAKSALSPANNVAGTIIIRRLLSPETSLDTRMDLDGCLGADLADKMPLTFTNEARQRINEPRPISKCVTCETRKIQ